MKPFKIQDVKASKHKQPERKKFGDARAHLS